MQKKKNIWVYIIMVFFSNNLVTFSFSCRDYSRHYRLENVPKIIWKKIATLAFQYWKSFGLVDLLVIIL